MRGLRDAPPGQGALLHGSDHYGRGGAALHTISAIDIALWDIAGKLAGLPICALLCPSPAQAVAVYASELMPPTAAEAERLARRIVDSGCRALKLGWGPLGRDIRLDAELVLAARAGLGPDASLMLDGGRAYTVESARDLLGRVESADLAWFEEPLAPDDLDGYRRLTEATGVRITAGEADSGTAPFRALADRGISVLQPDLARCGGFSVGRELLELESEDVEIVPHCFSTGVLVAASLHLVAARERPWWSEYSVSGSPLVNGILEAPFALEDGMLAVPSGQGLGIELDEGELDRWRVL